MYQRKIQISFDWEKFRFASNEDVDLFYFEEKFRSTSKEDANLFYFEDVDTQFCTHDLIKENDLND